MPGFRTYFVNLQDVLTEITDVGYRTEYMKKFLLIVSALCMVSCSDHTGRQDAPEELKVLSWNVWHGGHSEKFPGKGCEGTIGILKASGADVILMIETYGCSDKVADSLGYYHRLLSDNLSVYSRYPIVRTYTFPEVPAFNFGGVEIDVEGRRIRVFDT